MWGTGHGVYWTAQRWMLLQLIEHERGSSFHDAATRIDRLGKVSVGGAGWRKRWLTTVEAAEAA